MVELEIHLFKVDIIGGPVLDESLTISPGSEIVTIDSPVGKLGLSTWYNVIPHHSFLQLRYSISWIVQRFKEAGNWYQKIDLVKGAQIILVPSAFTLMTGKDHWKVLLRGMPTSVILIWFQREQLKPR
jgi:predicted amidohydrolase